MALALRTAVRSIRTPNTLPRFPRPVRKYSQQLLFPEAVPKKLPLKQRVTEYFADPNNCVFPKHLNVWQKFVCGGIGLTGGFIGLGIGGGLAYGVSESIFAGVNFINDKYTDYVYGKKTRNIALGHGSQTADDEDSIFSALTNGCNFIIQKIGDGIITVFVGVVDVYSEIPDIVVDSTMISASTAIVPFSASMSFIVIGGFWQESKKFFKEIRTMENCCNIIRFGAKGTLATLAFCATIAFTSAASVGMTYNSYLIFNHMSDKWENNKGNNEEPYLPTGDEYDEVYDTSGPILD